MAKKKMNQTDALEAILSQGKKRTMAQLMALVSKKTGRTVAAASLDVCISHLRKRGANVVTYRGSGARDGITRYVIE